MLVTRIIGSCPGCGRERSFGNVNIGNNMLLRGCLHCKYSEDLPLPDLDKKVLYLDQYFFSHAFRGGNDPRFRRAVDQIADLAHRQLLVSPYSSPKAACGPATRATTSRMDPALTVFRQFSTKLADLLR